MYDWLEIEMMHLNKCELLLKRYIKKSSRPCKLRSNLQPISEKNLFSMFFFCLFFWMDLKKKKNEKKKEKETTFTLKHKHKSFQSYTETQICSSSSEIRLKTENEPQCVQEPEILSN